MLVYALILLCLSLSGVAGLQFMYLFYVDRIDRERKKRLAELERRCTVLTSRLVDAEEKIRLQADMIHAFEPIAGRDEEAWADIIDDI